MNDSLSDPELSHHAVVAQAISMPLRLANLAVVVLPFLGFVALVVSLWGWGFHWVDLRSAAGNVCADGRGNHRWLSPTVHPPGL